jgi:hypothetical protein
MVDVVPGSIELLALGTNGGRLRVVAGPSRFAASAERAFDVSFEAEAHPFKGVLSDVLLASDLAAWRD